MIINDKNGLLKVNSMMDELLEELDQNAAGPELEKAAELDNEATLEKAPRELTPAVTNKDMYGDDEDFAEDVGEVVYESFTDEELYDILENSGYEVSKYNLELLKEGLESGRFILESEQLAAGPELEKAAELDNEATLEKAPRELTPKMDNKDIYGDDEDFAEDVGEVVVEEVLEFLLESDDDEFEELLPMLTEEQTDFCIDLLDSEAVVALCEQMNLTEAVNKNKVRAGVAAGGGIAAGVGATGGLHMIRKAGGWAAVKKGAATAGGLIGKGSVASAVGTGLAAAGAGALAAHAIKKGVQKIKNERAARKHAAALGTQNLGVKDKNGNEIESSKNYNYASRREDRKTALEKNRMKHLGRKEDKDNYKLLKKDVKKGAASSEELQAAKEKAAASQRAYVVDKKRIKREAKLNAKIARSQARSELKRNTLNGEQAYDTQKRMNYHTDKDVSDGKGGTRKQTAEEAKKENLNRKVAITESYTDLELMQLLENNGYNATLNNLLILKEGLEDGSYEIFYEEELETEVMPAEAEDRGVADDEPAERGEEKEDSEEKKDEEKEETVNEGLDGIFALINQINESLAQTAAGPELDSAKELDNEATAESDGKELTSTVDNKDVYDAEDHEQKEDVGEVVVKESEQLAAGPELEGAKELKNEATVETAEKELTSDKDNKDLFPAEDHEQKEDVGEVVVKESEQLAAGPELEGAKELKNEATEEKEGKTAPSSTDNKDVYCDGCHKQVEDVVEVVVEAVSACKAKGKPATKENIAEEAKELFEMANFDIDAFIMSREMNGSKKFDEYEKLEGKGAECALTGLRESVKYNSLKEACMMDEGYFAEDSYVKETAGEKVAKLTEQVSLLMAREANDPLYDELLKESAYCMRLREQLQNKYKRAASAKVNVITESKN